MSVQVKAERQSEYLGVNPIVGIYMSHLSLKTCKCFNVR